MSNQQKWGNPAPWGIFSVGVLTASLGALHGGLVPMSSAPLLIGILLAAVLPQVIAAVICYRREGELVLATNLGLFGTMVTLGAALTTWFQVGGLLMFGRPPASFTPEIMGPFWITLFVITEVFAIGYLNMSWFVAAGIAEVGVVFLLEGIYSLQGAPIAESGYITAATANVAGYLAIIFAAFCVYAMSAVMLNENFGKQVLPLGGPVVK